MTGEAQLQSKKEEARQQVLVPRETILMYNTYNYLKMNNKTLLENLRCIPDFPKKESTSVT